MLKTLEKNWKKLVQKLKSKPLVGWVTEPVRKYKTNIIYRTKWNIIIFHVFFVVVMVAVFWFILRESHYALYEVFSNALDDMVNKRQVNTSAIETAFELNEVSRYILITMIAMSVVASAALAHITLVPARRAFEQQKRFIGAIAHELRTPLAILRTQNEVALYDVDKGTPLHETINDNIEQTAQLSEILNNLLLFNRVDNLESISFAELDVVKIAEDVKSKLSELSGKNNVQVEVINNNPSLINANEVALYQALYNLTKNAILYCKPTGGKVYMTLSNENGSHVVISISDNGKGIPKDKLPFIFEPFYRVDESRHAKGTGLGLSLVFEIVKLHKGLIEVDSTEDKGTTFRIKLPTASGLLKKVVKPTGSLRIDTSDY